MGKSIIINGKEYILKSKEETIEAVLQFLKSSITSSLQDVFQKGTIKLKETTRDYELVSFPSVDLQIYYSERTNKVFIEYDVNRDIRALKPRDYIAEFISGYINTNMKDYIRVFPEIILMEENIIGGKNKDSGYRLTPYTIGYWDSITGGYEFIEDRTEVELDLEKLRTPSIEPADKFIDFINTTDEIFNRYKRVELSDEDKTSYINSANNIWFNYKDDLDTYNDKMRELAESYDVVLNIRDRIPEMFDEYKQAYLEFFDRDLGDVFSEVIRKKYEVLNLIDN